MTMPEPNKTNRLRVSAPRPTTRRERMSRGLVQRRGRSLVGAALLAVLVLASVVRAQQNQAEPLRPYLQGDVDRLGRMLQRMGMTEMLSTLAAQSDSTAIELRALDAERATLEPEELDKRLLSIAGKLKAQADAQEKQIEQAREPIRKAISEGDTAGLTNAREAFYRDNEDRLIEYYRKRVRYLDLMVIQRSKPYVDKLIFLIGGAEDRKTLLELTRGVIEDLGRLEKQITRELEDARESSRSSAKLAALAVYLVPQLEDIANTLRFSAGYVRYYRAMAMPETIVNDQGQPEPNNKRLDLLDLAVRLIEPFAQDDVYGVQTQATLLKGRAYRELGQYDLAEAALTWATGPDAKQSMLVESLFSQARNYIAWGESLIAKDKQVQGAEKFAQAKQAIDSFTAKGIEAVGTDNALGVDVKKLLLEYTLYYTWAQALRKAEAPDLAKEKDLQAQKSFLNFLNKYPDPGIQGAIGEMVRDKFRGRDWKQLDPVLILLIGIAEMNEAEKALAKNPQDDQAIEQLAKAESMFEAIRTSDAESAQQAIPDALWRLGVIRLKNRKNFEAAEMFRELVARFPEHERAFDAALLAVKINRQLIILFMEDSPGEPVPMERRQELIKSIELLVSKWPDKPEAADYNFDLGFQYQQLADMETGPQRTELVNKAMAAYDRVPPDSVLAPEARFYRLELRTNRIESTQDPAAAGVSRLIEDLRAFGQYARDKRAAAPTQRDDTGQPTQADLGRWGSRAEYFAAVLEYEKLGEHDKALAQLKDLPQRWPDTPVLQESKDFLIRKLLASGKVAEGVEEFQQFQQQYGREETNALMRQVVSTLKQTIDELAAAGKEPQKLAAFRDAYKNFGKQLYEGLVSSADVADRYAITVLYADALVQSGQKDDAARALQLLDKLAAENQARRDKQAAEIDAQITPSKDAVRSNSRPALDRALEQYQQIKQKVGMGDWDSMENSLVIFAFKRLDDESLIDDEWSEQEKTKFRQDRRDQAAEAIQKAYDAMAELLKRRLAMDANVPYLQGKAKMNLGQYEEAVDILRPLALGLDPQMAPEIYWDTQLMLLRASLEKARAAKDVKTLRGLLVRLNQMRTSAPWPNHYQGRFNRIDYDAQDAIKSLSK